MSFEFKMGHAVVLGAIAGLIGCAGGTPTTGQATVQTMGADLLPPPAVAGDRHLQADLEQMDVQTFDSLLGQLPARISVADAERMLVKIDPSKVVEAGKSYSLQARGGGGGHGGGGHGGGFHGGGFRGNSFHGNSFHHGGRFFNNSFFGSSLFGYYPYSSYYFPYYNYGSYYYPYSYGGYSPFLYGYGGYNSLLNPYTYGGGTLPWANSGVTMPAPPAAQAPAAQAPAATPTPMPAG